MISFYFCLLIISSITKLSNTQGHTRCYSENMPNHLRMVSRSEWQALPQKRDEIPDHELPVDKIILLHTKTDNCFTEVCLFIF